MSSGAFALVLLLPDDSFDSWGWRLPFLAAFPLLVIAFYIRRRVEESPVFDQLLAQESDRPKIPAGEVFTHAWGRLLVAIAAAFLGVGGFYVLTTFAISYGVDTLGLSRTLMVNATLVAAVVEIGAIVLFGRVADRLGPGRVTFWGGLASAVLALPVFALLTTRSPAAVVLAISAGIAALSVAYAVTGALLAELFPARYRYSGVALAYNFAGALNGFLPFPRHRHDHCRRGRPVGAREPPRRRLARHRRRGSRRRARARARRGGRGLRSVGRRIGPATRAAARSGAVPCGRFLHPRRGQR